MKSLTPAAAVPVAPMMKLPTSLVANLVLVPEPTVAHGSEARLRQVVTNLVANALRHTPEGTPVEVAVGTDDEGVALEVRDHGPGVPPDISVKVFERFFRADPSRGRGSGGSGLGLAIVAAIVAGHHGRVGVAETPGGGATFVVRLPQVTPSL